MNYDLPKSYFDNDIFAQLEPELADDHNIKKVIRRTEERPEPDPVFEEILKPEHYYSIMADNLQK